MNNRFPQCQQGAAMVMFMLMLPVLVGLMFLTVDSGRFLRLKAQVADATEVASLAVSALPLGPGGWNEEEEKARRETLARNYMAILVPDLGGNPGADRLNVTIRYEKSDDSDSLINSYIQYTLNITTKHDAIFPAKPEASFGFTNPVTFVSQSKSRKYNGVPVDLVLVADFSDSMNSKWYWKDSNGKKKSQKKFTILKDVVKNTVEKIESYSQDGDMKSTISLVPFNAYTNKETPRCATLQAVIEWEEKKSNGEFKPKVPWSGQKWGNRSNDHKFYVNVQATLDRIFETKGCLENKKPKYYERNFYTIEFPEKYGDIITKIKEMEADHHTASYEGIIRGSQIAYRGKTPRRLIVVLSDGNDRGPSHGTDDYGYNPVRFHAKRLEANPNYCDKIRSELNASDIQVQSKIAVIGFDYDVDKNPYLKKCAGDDNVYEATDPASLNAILDGLIDEEIGHLYRQ